MYKYYVHRYAVHINAVHKCSVHRYAVQSCCAVMLSSYAVHSYAVHSYAELGIVLCLSQAAIVPESGAEVCRSQEKSRALVWNSNVN